MTTLHYEIKQMLRYQMGMLYLLLFIVGSIAVLMFTDQPSNFEVEYHREQYYYYLEQVQGAYSEEKAHFLETEAQVIAQAEAELQQLYENYYGGDLSDEEFNETLSDLTAKLENQQGFEIIFEQYLYICENTENRYFLQTNGWNGLLANEGPDVLLLLTIVLLIVPIFCREYTCQMDALIITSSKGSTAIKHKIRLALIMTTMLCVAKFFMQFVFYDIKYSLPNWNYPIQSISFFAESTKCISLIEVFLLIFGLRLVGYLFFAAIILALSVISRKYSISVFLSCAIIMLPYFGLSNKQQYILPTPLAFILGSGFLKGNIIETDAFTSEVNTIFSEISVGKLILFVILTIIICFTLIRLVYMRTRNVWNRCLKRSVSTIPILMCCILFFMLAGCASEKSEISTIYNETSSRTYQTDDYRVYFDMDTQELQFEDNRSDIACGLIRSPLETASGSTSVLSTVFGTGKFVYYLKFTTNSHINKVGYQASTSVMATVVEVNLSTFEEQVIFEKKVNGGNVILGIEYENNNAWSFIADCHGFFLNEDNIYFVGEDIWRVSLRSYDMEVLDIPTKGNIAYDGKRIYYINDQSVLVYYNTATRNSYELDSIIASDFLITEQEIVYINRRDESTVYRCDFGGENVVQISSQPAISLTFDNRSIYYYTKNTGDKIKLN